MFGHATFACPEKINKVWIPTEKMKVNEKQNVPEKKSVEERQLKSFDKSDSEAKGRKK